MEETTEEQREWDKAVDCCAFCGEKPSRTMKCSRCQACFYCSVACQKKAYKKHKKQCLKIAEEKKAAGASWRITTHEVPDLPHEHHLVAQPNAAGVKLAKEVLTAGTMPAEVKPFNPILATWMESLCCLTNVELRKVADSLMKYDGTSLGLYTQASVLLPMFLVGCSAAGQPTLEEILQFKHGGQSVSKLATTGVECSKNALENGDEFFWTRSLDPMTDACSANGMLTMARMNSPGESFDIFEMMDNYCYCNPGTPRVPLDVGTVRRDFQAVLKAVGIDESIPINARMHVTSFRVLSQSGVPPQFAALRCTPASIWMENTRRSG